jgi:pimeloyl-ACP methyl ester carboxylesterase
MRLAGDLPGVRFGDDAAPAQLVVFSGAGDALQAPDYLSTPDWRLRMFFQRYYGRYADRFRVWVIGRRRGMPSDYATTDMARDYARALESEIGPAHVRGESLGGLVAQHLAIDRPDLVSSLTLVATAARLGAEGRRLCEAWLSWAGDGEWSSLFRDMTQCLYGGPGAGLSEGALELLGSFVGVHRPADPSDFLVSVRACLAHDTSARLAEIAAPTLVVSGDVDPLFPMEELRSTEQSIPQASLVVIPGTAHGAFLVQPEAFDNAVLHFLGDLLP